VKKRAGELDSQMTYRKVGVVLSEEVGTPVSAQHVHGWVQEAGKDRTRTAPRIDGGFPVGSDSDAGGGRGGGG
jgi:hypothetical protein